MALPEIKVRVSAETGGLDAGLTSATASLNRFSKTSQQVAQQMSGMTKNTDAAAGAVTNIGYQFQDIAMMIASGQSPFMLAMQQGTQLSGILNSMKNPIQGLASAFLTVINPVSLITIATIGLGAAAIQAFANIGKSSAESNIPLEGHLSKIKQIATGYVDAQKAAANLVEQAKLLPQGVVEMQLGAQQKAQSDEMKKSLENLVAVNKEFIDQLNFYNRTPSIGLQNQIKAIEEIRIEAQSATPNLDKMLTTLQDLALNAADKTIRSAAQEMYNAAQRAKELQVASQATSAALGAMASNALSMARAFNENIKGLSGLYMDQRSSYEQARASADAAYKASINAAGGEIERTAAAQEYKRVLDSINAAEAAAAARTNAPSGGGGADKAAILAEQIAQLQASLEGEIAVETAAYQKKMELLAQYYDGKDALIAERQQYEQLATQQHADKLEQIEAATRAKKMQEQQMMVGNLTSVLGSISQIIGSEGDKQIALQKGISTAIAAINIAQGITKAFELPFPMNWTQAAAVAASGAAQIAAINSASRGGGSKVASPSATSGGVASAAMNRTLTVQGITPGQIFSGDSMRDFMERMLEMQRDGYQVVLA